MWLRALAVVVSVAAYLYALQSLADAWRGWPGETEAVARTYMLVVGVLAGVATGLGGPAAGGAVLMLSGLALMVVPAVVQIAAAGKPIAAETYSALVNAPSRDALLLMVMGLALLAAHAVASLIIDTARRPKQNF